MIRRLKRKFILLSSVSLLLLLALIVAGMNLINYRSVAAESDKILSLLSKNEGKFPGFDDGRGDRLPPNFSPELPHEARYFSVLFSSDGTLLFVDTSRISSVDRTSAVEYARRILDGTRSEGFTDQFRYRKSVGTDTVRITLLDRGRQLDAFRAFLLASISMALLGFFTVFFLFVFFAGRIIRPIAESYEKQKCFITDAGHEIKTPLTVIRANTDLLEMELGPNDSLDDIRAQTDRLAALTEDLTLLSRMEEHEGNLQMIEFPISEIVSDAAKVFYASAELQEKDLVLSVEPMLSAVGNARAVERLVTLLVDNALKYSPPQTEITLTLRKQAHSVVLTVTNLTDVPLTTTDFDRIFDRFYRVDPSRSSETGGHGIGLSVAKAIVTAHGGKIRASAPTENTFAVTAVFPA